jgi:predicted oxidoreductase
VRRVRSPGTHIHEAFDRLKEQGKVRFLGVGTHTPNLEESRTRPSIRTLPTS